MDHEAISRLRRMDIAYGNWKNENMKWNISTSALAKQPFIVSRFL